MNRSTLSPHWIQHHTSNELRQALIDWQPNTLKIFEPTWSSAQELEWLYRTQPGRLILWRDHPLSEQHDDMKADPVATGQRHADEWRVKLEVRKAQVFGVDFKRTYVLGINEPHVWDALDQTVAYTVAFLDRLTSYGLKGGALNLSVGWPGNNGPDTPPDWTPYAPIEAAIKRGGHVLVLHEYWDIAGPEKMRGWWAERFKACPWDVPIVIGEGGVDRWVDAANMGGLALAASERVSAYAIDTTWGLPQTGTGLDYARRHLTASVTDEVTAANANAYKRGWQPWLSADAYMRQLAQYDEWCIADGRIVGSQIFTFDYNDKQWQSFDVAQPPIRDAIVSHVKQSGPAQPPTPPDPEPLPPYTIDLVGKLPVHATKTYARRTQPLTTVVVHHSASPPDTPVNNIARYHVNTNGWPGIGYHYTIDGAGITSRTNTENTVSYHAGNANGYSVGVCLLGNFINGRLPTKAQFSSAARLIADILTRHGLTTAAIIGHKEAPGNVTRCPGDEWTAGVAWRDMLIEAVSQYMTAPPGAHTDLYLLLYQFDGGPWARADYLNAVNYVARFRPQIGFSIDEAMQARQCLIVGGPLGVSVQDENRIRAAGVQVARANGKDEAATAAILDALALAGTPLP